VQKRPNSAMNISSRLALPLAAVLMLGAAAAGAQDKLESKAELLSKVDTVFNGMCAQYRESAKGVTSIPAIRMADQGMALWCTCAPAEMKRLAADLGDPTSKPAILEIYNRATANCTGKQMRAAMIAACPTDQDVAVRARDVHAYCTCVEHKLSAKTDEQLGTELNQAYNAETRQAKAEGKDVLFLEGFGLRMYGADCEAASTTSLN
jgi:hypothetical protein